MSTRSTAEQSRQPPFHERTGESIPIALPSVSDRPAWAKGWFDDSAPTISIGEASIAALLLREQMWMLDEKRQVITGMAAAETTTTTGLPAPKAKTGPCAYTMRFLTSRIPVPVTEFVVPNEKEKAFLDWLRERVKVKREK
jgi:hypothetical protein